ncbi:MAG: agmatinase [Dehalococcoidia bacterium]|jgi:agmatinase
MNDSRGLFAQPGNFAGLPLPLSDLSTARVCILPVPYDSTTEWHSGTRNGPKSIIEASFYLEMYDIELGREICDVGIHTLTALEPVLNGPEAMLERVYQAVRSLLDQSKFVAMLGGEHSISYGAVRAFSEKYDNLSVLQLDAHTDLRDQYLGTKFSHACAMRRIIELCPITQVGIRSLSLEENQYIMSNKLKPFFFELEYGPSAIEKITASLNDNVYISIDLDVFDPSIMSAVGTPEPGGMSWSQVTSLLKTIAKNKNIVGFDVVELCPGQGPAACSFTAAKLIYKLLGYCFFNR